MTAVQPVSADFAHSLLYLMTRYAERAEPLLAALISRELRALQNSAETTAARHIAGCLLRHWRAIERGFDAPATRGDQAASKPALSIAPRSVASLTCAAS